MVEPLTRGQKMFNQRILAEHCIPEEEARQIWEDLRRDNDMGGSKMEESLVICNKQLAYTGLEIVAVSIRDENDKAKCYYSMINKFPDEISKKAFLTLFQPQQHAYVRVILEKLVEGPEKRSSLLNLRLEMEGSDTASKNLTLPAAEETLDALEDEKWIQSMKSKDGSNSAALGLAPRAYAELSYLLVQEFGMDKDELPQQILYR
jgi:hypothetical protein